MERKSGVGRNAFLTSAKGPEILSSFRNEVIVKLDNDSSFKLSAYGNV